MAMENVVKKLEEEGDTVALERIKEEAEVSMDGATVGLAEQALARLNAISKKAEAVGIVPAEKIAQVESLGGSGDEITSRTQEIDSKIAEVRADAERKVNEVIKGEDGTEVPKIEATPIDPIEKKKEIVELEAELNALLQEIEKSGNELDKFRENKNHNVPTGNQMMANLSSLWEKRDAIRSRLEKLTFDPQKAEEEKKQAVDALKEELKKIPDIRPYDREAEKKVVAKYYEKGDSFGFSDQEKEVLNKYLTDTEGVLKAEAKWFAPNAGTPITRAKELGNPENIIGQAEQKLQEVIKRLIDNDDKKNLRTQVITFLIDSPENRFSPETQRLLVQAYEKLDEGPMVATVHYGTGEQMDFRSMYETKVAALKKHLEVENTPVS